LLVRNHVEAKRYLTFKHPEYYNQLSEASKKTLEFQGGVMTEEEAIAFEKMPMFDLYLRMRTWDDLAKEVEFERPTLEKYRQMAWKHIGYRLN
jgi:predicted HD phosphohydrolase